MEITERINQIKRVKLARIAVLLALVHERKKREKRRRIWTRKWLSRRNEQSVYYRLLKESSLEDPEAMRNWIQLNKEQYQLLLNLVTPLIKKQDTNMRKAVTPGERLTITLRYLATGETYTSLSCQFRISKNLVSLIIPEVCHAIYQVLQPLYVKIPSSNEEWKNVASDFFTSWNFPHCIGALDGKRILTANPSNSGSQYYDYKGHCSIIMLALVDADYKFLYVDVGACGRSSDGGIWDRCSLKAGIERNVLNIPQTEILPLSQENCPYLIVADDAFPPKEYLMKPYPGGDQNYEKRIFNYRLSRARRVSENAFGILASRFQVFKNPVRTSPTNVKKITLAAVALHNFLRSTSGYTYAPPDFVDMEDHTTGSIRQGQWHEAAQGALENLENVPRGHSSVAKNIREKLTKYFNNEGRVSWQDTMAVIH